jgi:hypothetical protein
MNYNYSFLHKSRLLLLLLLLFVFNSCETDEVEEPFTAYRQDVKPTKIIDETFVLGGTLTANSNKSKLVKTIKPPANTKYWIFWFGVSQEAKEQYMATIGQIPKAAQKITTEPTIALGLEIINAINLAANSGSDNVDSFFAASLEDSEAFKNSRAWSYYLFFQGKQTVNVYRVIDMSDTPVDQYGNLYMTFENNKTFRDLDVQLKVWAFTEKP